MMVGREVLFSLERAAAAPGEVVLEVDGLVVPGDRGREAVAGVTFSIRQGEILGIAGVSGNGQRELVEAVTGLRRSTPRRRAPLGPRHHQRVGPGGGRPRHLPRARGAHPLRRRAQPARVRERGAEAAPQPPLLAGGVPRRTGHARARRGHRGLAPRRRPFARDAREAPLGRQHPEAHPRARDGGRARAARRLAPHLRPGRGGHGVRAPPAARAARARQGRAAGERGPRGDLRARRPDRGDVRRTPRRHRGPRQGRPGARSACGWPARPPTCSRPAPPVDAHDEGDVTPPPLGASARAREPRPGRGRARRQPGRGPPGDLRGIRRERGRPVLRPVPDLLGLVRQRLRSRRDRDQGHPPHPDRRGSRLRVPREVLEHRRRGPAARGRHRGDVDRPQRAPARARC